MKQMLLERDGDECQGCVHPELGPLQFDGWDNAAPPKAYATLDHFPIAARDGGPDTLENLRLRHLSCNSTDCIRMRG